ncbi:MAG: 2-keto-4-pentenoate hydratase, partial [Alphaproteobacteria bacterium]|nr:2-keto-4-pentenoate hydratase [Alphaproteobacteria bacterium]
MRLATLKEGGRDGVLVVVSRDLQRAIRVQDIAKTLQRALDDWAHAGPKLEVLYKQLSAGVQMDGAFAFDQKRAASPLPRAFQCS